MPLDRCPVVPGTNAGMSFDVGSPGELHVLTADAADLQACAIDSDGPQ